MLELKHVTKTFGAFKALDDLTLTVPKGAVYGLVGPPHDEPVAATTQPQSAERRPRLCLM